MLIQQTSGSLFELFGIDTITFQLPTMRKMLLTASFQRNPEMLSQSVIPEPESMIQSVAIGLVLTIVVAMCVLILPVIAGSKRFNFLNFIVFIGFVSLAYGWLVYDVRSFD
jgi:hypothetical protein